MSRVKIKMGTTRDLDIYQVTGKKLILKGLIDDWVLR